MNALERFVWNPEDVEWNAGGQKDFDPNQPRDPHTGEWIRGGVLDVVDPAPTMKLPDRELQTVGLSPAAIESVYGMCAAQGVTHEALVAELEDRIGGKDAAVMQEAADWYPQAHDSAQRFADDSNGRISFDQAAAVIAAISPRCDWDLNIEAARRICALVGSGDADGLSDDEATVLLKQRYEQDTGKGMSIFDNRVSLAFKLARGADIDTTLHGLKVRSFFDNISEPGQTREVTNDGHMTKLFGAISDISSKDAGTLLGHDSKEAGQEHAGAGYIAAAMAVRELSTRWGVPPDQIQAAYWIKVRDLKWKDLKT